MFRKLITDADNGRGMAKLCDPCTENEINEAEKAVGCKFPRELKELLLETNGDGWLFLSAEQIIRRVEMNRAILSEAFDSHEEFEEKVDRHIFFATNGCGDMYCYRIDTNGEADGSAIYFWDHETFDCVAVAKDIPDLIRKYYNDEI